MGRASSTLTQPTTRISSRSQQLPVAFHCLSNRAVPLACVFTQNPFVIKILALAIGLLFLGAPGFAQNVAVVKFPELQQRLARPTDTTYIVNFWATWCAPCVQELPAFEQVRAANVGKKVKVLLVSLDYASQLDKKVKPFLKQRGLQSETVLLNETDPNTWLNQVDGKWSGALPFTLIVNNHTRQRATFEHELSVAELATALQKFPN